MLARQSCSLRQSFLEQMQAVYVRSCGERTQVHAQHRARASRIFKITFEVTYGRELAPHQLVAEPSQNVVALQVCWHTLHLLMCLEEPGLSARVPTTRCLASDDTRGSRARTKATAFDVV